LDLIKEKEQLLASFVTINNKFSFVPSQFKLKNDLLGVFREADDVSGGRSLSSSSRYIRNGISMILTAVWYFLSGLYFLALGLTSILVGLIYWTIQQINQSFRLTRMCEKKIANWRKMYSFSVVEYEKSLKETN